MPASWIDAPQAVRPGEALDTDALTAYLKANLPGFSPPLRVAQFPRGFSNLTYMIEDGTRQMVLRRPPFGSRVKTAHDMGREFHILSRLSPVYDKAPRPLLYCDEESVLGAPFYVMERIEGVILRGKMPEAMTPDPDTMTGIAAAFVRTFADLHALDVEAAGLGDMGRPEGYVARQVEGWTRRYQKAQTDDLEAMTLVAAWLHEHQPPTGPAALIHNDFKYDNLVLDAKDWTCVKAVLDWEMTTVGDPLMDLGSTLGYWLDADDPPELRALQLSPTTLPGNPSRAELVQWYVEASGREVDHVVFYYAYGLFKLAVIIQQIYARYKKGHTQDPRFARLIDGVRGCAFMAVQAIGKGRIDGLFA